MPIRYITCLSYIRVAYKDSMYLKNRNGKVNSSFMCYTEAHFFLVSFFEYLYIKNDKYTLSIARILYSTLSISNERNTNCQPFWDRHDR